jgi:beta-glucosidase
MLFEEKATMFGKTLHRDDRTAAELVAEALKIANQSDVIVALGESAEMSGKAVAERILKFHKHRKTYCKNY